MANKGKKIYSREKMIYSVIGNILVCLALVVLLYYSSIESKVQIVFICTFLLFMLLIGNIGVLWFKFEEDKSFKFENILYSSIFVGIIAGLISNFMNNPYQISVVYLAILFGLTTLYSIFIFVKLKKGI
ncbi:hypothetical protein J4477_03520 [Candidatus Pacearchaeota archaeon]|nr:hypothetical protein [Candidatus Pacearchaeota archaeon]